MSTLPGVFVNLLTHFSLIPPRSFIPPLGLEGIPGLINLPLVLDCSTVSFLPSLRLRLGETGIDPIFFLPVVGSKPLGVILEPLDLPLHLLRLNLKLPPGLLVLILHRLLHLLPEHAHLLLVLHNLGVNLPIQLLTSTRLRDILVLIDQFHLYAQWYGVIVEDQTNDLLGRGDGVLVASDLGTLVEDGLEENVIRHQLGFTRLTDLGVDFPPHVGDDDNIPKGAFATELLEHLEIPGRNPTHPEVGDAVEV